MSDLSQRIASLSPEKRKLLEEKILHQRQQQAPKRSVLARRKSDGPAPLSLAQRRLWFLHRFAPEDVSSNIPMVLKLKGELDVPALENAIEVLVERHEILRTSFSDVDGGPVQTAHKGSTVELGIREVSASDIAHIAKEISQAPFDLNEDMPVRFCLLRISDRENWLLVVAHHIVADGWSLNIIQDELAQAYAGEFEALPELPLQYADVAEWQRDHETDLAPQLEYWRDKLGHSPAVLDLPTDRPRPVQMGNAGARVRAKLPIELIESLQKLGMKHRSTLFMVILAALTILLSRLSGQDDISVGSPVAGRVRSEFEKLVGVFINTIVLRNDLSGAPSFEEFLGRVRDVTLGALSNQDIAFEKLIEELHPKRDLSRSPFFQVLLVLQNQAVATEKMGDVSIERDFIETDTAMYDLSFYIHPRPDHYLLKLEFSTDLFDASTAQRMLAQLRLLLESVVENPEESIERLPVLPVEEKKRLLDDWNQTGIEHGEQEVVHELISQQAIRTPPAIAIEFEDQCCTYAELETRSNQLARRLQSLGVSANSAVGVYLERSIEMIVGLLAIWKAGGYYVPLDPSFPVDRLAFMVSDAGLDLLLSHSSLEQQLPLLGEMPVLMLDADAGQINAHSAHPLDSSTTLDSLAYVIYTSGSTGQPKGVPIQQSALANFLHSMALEPGIKSTDRLLAVTTLSFDIAGLELYLPLISGASVLLASREEALDARLLAGRIVSGKVSVMQATPATWRMLLDSEWAGEPGLKVLCGGESLSRELADLLLDRCKELWNMYGPTETTIWSLVKRIERGECGPVLVGRPIANTTVYILDKYLRPLPIGVTGELMIGGDGLATGYHGREELTADRFIQHPFQPGGRLYRTGDLARYHADGQLEILGRIDHQVKVRGFRIELGEIESMLNTFPSLEQALVVAREDMTGEKMLVAYYQSAADLLSSGDLRAHLKRTLPDYMIPSFFMKLKEYPLTPNGKIDRKALPAPDGSQRELEQDYIAPTTDMQTKLTGLWAEVLGLQRVGIRDNFFDLGGHSLLALRLIARMERELGISLPLIALFQGRTIEDITFETPGVEADRPSALVAIREQGSLAPFFAIGSHPRYVDVARRVDLRRPFYRLDVYALQSSRMAQGQKIYQNVEELLNEFVDSIQAVQPTGPYYLGGGCEGALIAFAVANELQRRGEEVAKLILWITPAPHYGNGAVFGKVAFFRVVDQMKTLARHLQVADMNLRTLIEIVKHEYIEFRIFRAMDKYSPTQKFDGEIMVARTVENRKPWDTDLAMGWGGLATNGSRVHKLHGNHDNWLVGFADEFGDFLDSCLSEQRSD